MLSHVPLLGRPCELVAGSGSDREETVHAVTPLCHPITTNYNEKRTLMPSNRTSANRQNALQSTGPRTASGKLNSSKNAVRHGTYSEAIPILGEDPAEFDALTADLRRSLQPVGPLEGLLVGRMAGLWWRLNRAGKAEREGLATTLQEARRELGIPRLLNDFPFEDFLPVPAPDHQAPTFTAYTWGMACVGLDRLLCYERQLERRFFGFLHELERLQERRQGQAVLPPKVVNLDGSEY